MDDNLSIMIGMAVLTTAIDRTLNSRTAIRITNCDMGVIDPCQLIMDFTGSTYVTS